MPFKQQKEVVILLLPCPKQNRNNISELKAFVRRKVQFWYDTNFSWFCSRFLMLRKQMKCEGQNIFIALKFTSFLSHWCSVRHFTMFRPYNADSKTISFSFREVQQDTDSGTFLRKHCTQLLMHKADLVGCNWAILARFMFIPITPTFRKSCTDIRPQRRNTWKGYDDGHSFSKVLHWSFSMFQRKKISSQTYLPGGERRKLPFRTMELLPLEHFPTKQKTSGS